MKSTLSFLYIILSVFVFHSCVKNKIASPTHERIINVKTFGAKGDGKTDDRIAIQNALKKNTTLFFPKGKYLLQSRTANYAFILINSLNAPHKLIFDKEAEIIVSKNQKKDNSKPAVFFISPKKGNISSIKFIGLSIEGNSNKHTMTNAGILAYTHQNYKIDSLFCENVSMKNMGGAGIHTGAHHNYLNNIYTQNSGSHGIAATNKNNSKYTVELFLNNYTSMDDNAYSIDLGFQMKKVGVNKSEIKNVTSINSNLGIKTAGAWDVKFENILIENSQHNGFYVNHDAPNHTIKFSKLKIINPQGTGLALSNKTKFIGDNIQIINAGIGALFVGEANATIDSLFIDGNYRSKFLMRFGNNESSVTNFEIKNSSPTNQYPIWIKSKKLTLQNGVLKNISSNYPIIFHKNAKDVTLDNIISLDKKGIEKPEIKIMNIQENGKFRLLDKDKKIKSKYKVRTKN